MRKASLTACVIALAACGPESRPDVTAPFNTDWLNDQGSSISEVEAGLRAAPTPPETNVVVGVTENSLIGAPLDGGRRWTHPATPDTLPAIAGNLVIYSQAGKVFALDATTGKPLWKVNSEGYRLRGAGDDGSTSVLSLGRGGGRRDSLLLGVTRSGSVTLRLQTDKELGRPAAKGGIAFVPWAGQYVSALELESGLETGRLLSRELTSHAFFVGPDLFFGEHSLIHFDRNIRLASTGQTPRAALPERALPGKPVWLEPGGDLPTLDKGARAKIRLIASPRFSAKGPHFASNRFAATYFRALMVFDAKNAELSWVSALPSAILGGAAAESGFVVCSADGKALRFGAEGGAAGSVDLGAELRACVVNASSFVVPAGAPKGPLPSQLAEVLSILDPDMAAAQSFLVTELARSNDPSVAKTLIELTKSSRIPPDVRASARKLLAERRSGAEYMLSALEQHYDFLAGTLPPPVGPLATALAAMQETRAAPLLARHLNDPATELADVELTALALEKLATPAELSSLKTFFALYRATADEPALLQAALSVAKALIRVGGPDGKLIVESAAKDSLTRPELGPALTNLTAPPPAPAAPPESAPAPAPVSEKKGT